LLLSSAAAGLGVATGFGIASLHGEPLKRSSPTVAGERIAFYGPHQAGIDTPPPNHLHFAAFDLTSDNLTDLRDLLSAWSEAATLLTAGEPLPPQNANTETGPPDTGETIGSGPSALTLTIGLGPSLFDTRRHLGIAHLMPAALTPLPALPGENLDHSRSGGDLAIQACSTDAQVAFHAIHDLTRIAAPVAALRWTQTGFNRTSTSSQTQPTPRNLIGFKDGTNNIPTNDQATMRRYVWVNPGDGPEWMSEGTYMVTRRIQILLDVWDANPTTDQERTIGRHKLSGAPLGAQHEHDPPDLTAETNGQPLIPADAHIRLAAPQNNNGQRILRRGYSYTDPLEPTSGQLNAGLFFICFQRNPHKQFLTIQRRLAENDALNKNIIHTTNALFAIPPGAHHKGYIGETLFHTKDG
jgi:deferrochelatase/peroxidase EfeB